MGAIPWQQPPALGHRIAAVVGRSVAVMEWLTGGRSLLLLTEVVS
ncbi:hypothetical protein [Siphonobacter sp. BAB-5405]|nr:hypothetical protein [Siphonobacter sp. BAB-5405]